MKHLFLLVIFLIQLCAGIGNTFAQESAAVSRRSSVKLSVVYPSLLYSYENKLTDKSTYEIQGGVMGGLVFRKYLADARETQFIFHPTIDFGYKTYYNIKKRAEKGKDTSDNSANFFGISLMNIIGEYRVGFLKHEGKKYKGDVFTSGYNLGIVPKWGMNRKLNRNFDFSLQIGPALTTDFADMELSLYSHIGFSYIFR